MCEYIFFFPFRYANMNFMFIELNYSCFLCMYAFTVFEAAIKSNINV